MMKVGFSWIHEMILLTPRYRITFIDKNSISSQVCVTYGSMYW